MKKLFAAAVLVSLMMLTGCGDNGDPAPKGVVTNTDVDKMMQGQQANPAAATTPQNSGQSGGPAQGSPPGTSPADPLAGQTATGTAVGSSIPPR